MHPLPKLLSHALTTLCGRFAPARRAAPRPVPRAGGNALRTLAVVALTIGTAARAEPVATGVEDLIWPAVIVASPFILVGELLFGSDHSARATAEREAKEILDAHREQIPASGLYTGGIDLRWALKGMLVDSRLPFIETDTAGSAWLLALVKDPRPLIAEAEKHKYIRISWGPQGSPGCVTWQYAIDQWIAGPPVRPGTCLRAVFDDELLSPLRLDVDASRIGRRQLRWNLVDRATGTQLLSVPFWEAQVKGQPLQARPTYRDAKESSAFVRLVQKLSPVDVPDGPGGRPYLMKRLAEPGLDVPDEPAKVQGRFRLPAVDWQALPLPPRNESWDAAYARAIATARPVVLNNALLVIPGDDRVGRACSFPGWLRCDFTDSFVSDAGVLTLSTGPSYGGSDGKGPGAGHLPPRSMYVEVAARRFSGEMLWLARITPESLPAPFGACEDFSLACSFYPRQATTTEKELVVRGVFTRAHYTTALRLPSDEYELVVPLADLPPAAQAR